MTADEATAAGDATAAVTSNQANAATACAQAAAERAARDSYGRLIAFLSARSRDVAGAQDALSEAFCAALEAWPRSGVPDAPEAWLLTAARRRLIDVARHARVQDAAVPDLLAAADEAEEFVADRLAFPDERLKLMFICAHPAIDVAARAPLILQTVLALDAARIASAFLVRPTAMGQRLTRAKAKIRDARIPFELPEAADLPPRLSAVLDAIYAAYGSAWDDVAGADERRKGLARESIDLGRLLLQLMPGEPEVLGLLALMLYCEARRDARRGPGGEYVSLSEQDTSRWSTELIAEAETLLRAAGRGGRIGRYQIEAAIQSVHVRRLTGTPTDWRAIAALYEGLVRLVPAIGARVGQAAAVAEAEGAERGWALLQEIPGDAVSAYQPYWALAAHLLARMQRVDEARAAYARAIGLCEEPAMRAFLSRRRASLTS